MVRLSKFIMKEGNFDTCQNMDESRGLYAKRNKCHHQRTNIIRLYLYEILRVVKFKETESQKKERETESIMVFARAWREGEMESCFMDIDRASVFAR